jgi:biotin-dependent carboxylase-like uncharacterized protein
MIEVLAPGPLLIVQDLGRPGARRYGVPQGGAMDSFALTAANRLVGNPPGAAGLELTAGGAELLFTRPARLALTGADLGASVDGRPMPLWSSLLVGRGARLRLAGRRSAWGARAYLAVAGGLALPAVLGSRSTDLGGAFGGLDGRPLRRGDLLEVGPEPPGSALALGQSWPEALRPPYRAAPTLRLVPGPHADCFAPEALARLAAAELRVSPTSNRMGYRLEGLALPYARPCSLPSLGVVPGAVQVPPDGAPILLMADAQTTGGYPLIGVVAAADLPLAAQLLPGDHLQLAPTTLAEALAARRAQGEALALPLDDDGDELLAALAGMPG